MENKKIYRRSTKTVSNGVTDMNKWATNSENNNKEIKTFNVEGMELMFEDISGSQTLRWVVSEALIEDEYGLKEIEFKKGDVVLDIGANIGCVSIYLAKKNPDITIYAYEAHPVNYDSLIHNLNLNNVTNVVAINKAVYSKTGETLKISLDENNTGATSCFVDSGNEAVSVLTISMDDIIKEHGITELKLLKIDCEGAEFDIFNYSESLKVIEIENLGMEVHGYMRHHGKDFDLFYEQVNSLKIKNKKVKQLG
jgi:FkbM family methyltransferase